MRYTRRDIGKLALSALPAASLLRWPLSGRAQSPLDVARDKPLDVARDKPLDVARDKPLEVARDTHPNSTINGVRVGAITYSYRTMPDQTAEAILRYVVDSGISQIEF